MNYDHNHEMTSGDAWNFLEVYQETRDILNFQEPLQECALEFNEGCSTKECEECHDVPGLKCSVEFSEHYSDVEREFCHDEMSQECATEYSEECSTEIKEEYFESSGHECTTEIFEQCKDVQWKVCHDQPTEQCSTEYSVKKIFQTKPNLVWILRLAKSIFFPNQSGIGLENRTQFFGVTFPNQTGFGLEKDTE